MGITGPRRVEQAQTDYTPIELANYFIKTFGGSEGISHMKLQKLVYLAYGWWLSHYDHPVIKEAPQAWKYGPVFDSLYQSLRTKGREAIKTEIVPVWAFFDKGRLRDVDNANVTQLLDWIWGRYGHLNGIALSDITHQPDTPWSEVVKSHEFQVPKNLPIDWELVKDHYRKLSERASGEAANQA